MKRTALILALSIICTGLFAEGRDNPADGETRGPDRVFMPKGDFSAGVSFFYVDLFSDNSEYLMLVQNLNANATMMSLSPYLDYTYHDNKSVGLRVKYSSAKSGVSDADLSMLSDDLSLSVEDMTADSRSIQASVFHRVYAPLDKQRRIGVFTDISLGYSNTRSSFSYNSESLDSYSIASRVKFTVHPGIMVFVTNSISTHVSIGIGGASYNHVDYYKGGEIVGTRDFSKVHFMLDVLDISFGLSFHI